MSNNISVTTVTNYELDDTSSIQAGSETFILSIPSITVPEPTKALI
jgi:hypothetical protein